MKRNWLTVGLICGTFFTVTTGGFFAFAGQKLTAPADKIKIEGKKPAFFNHTTHVNLDLSCGSCHHDAKHSPLSAEKIGALSTGDSLRCGHCHNKDFANPKLQKPKDVFHARCKTCHQKTINGLKGPTGCSGCHGKKTRKKPIEGC